ncbi:hypothetical protein CNMCM7691_006334 [Aspergillus felis]|uniref:Uncharacterized protein n=1 Tax=Aspergillus felis TaxID=1287682 RepID=A0A8H6R787_9EURO|nr:hypothetical protein CNMCM7691_006334 [Aspergillus felis]
MSTSIRMSPTPPPDPATSFDGCRESKPPVESSSAPTDLRGTPVAEQEGQTFERTTDEQYVNQALMAFLDAVALNILNNKCTWGIRHLAFKVEFKKATMESRTDGYLYGPEGGDEAFAIVETKAHPGKDGAKASKSTCKNPPRWSLGYSRISAKDTQCP